MGNNICPADAPLVTAPLLMSTPGLLSIGHTAGHLLAAKSVEYSRYRPNTYKHSDSGVTRVHCVLQMQNCNINMYISRPGSGYL